MFVTGVEILFNSECHTLSLWVKQLTRQKTYKILYIYFYYSKDILVNCTFLYIWIIIEIIISRERSNKNIFIRNYVYSIFFAKYRLITGTFEWILRIYSFLQALYNDVGDINWCTTRMYCWWDKSRQYNHLIHTGIELVTFYKESSVNVCYTELYNKTVNITSLYAWFHSRIRCVNHYVSINVWYSI